MRRRLLRAGDDGAASVLVLGLLGVAAALIAAIAVVAGAHTARADAQAAADLAALAAAQQHAVARAGACATGSQTASRNGARVTGCLVAEDGSVTVTVRRDLGGVAAVFGGSSVDATARAGPAWLRQVRAQP